MTSNNIGFTEISVQRSQFTWKIKNFSLLSYCMKGSGAKLESPTFTVKPNDAIKWRLILWPNGHNDKYSEFLSVSLCNVEYDNSKIQVQFALSVLDDKGGKRYEQSQKFSSWNSYNGYNEFIEKNILSEENDILVNDVLIVHCEMSVVYENGIKNFNEIIQHEPICIDRKVLNAFEKQLEKEEFSDVKLVASCGKELPAHKFVLAAHSPVFLAMFTSDMKEKNDHSFAIEDLDYNSIKEMLRFMYSGKVDNLDKVANGVLAAQEKYQIDGLKEYCEEYFFHNINIENVVEILALSMRYNIDKIKFLCTKFIQCHGKDVSETAAFKAIDEPNLLAEIVRILVNE